ncbi:gfo/Idh/MocA family oxidoreductase, partial [Listeria monocytogenes]|uniref:Gfo/Idh/MocA family protein n=1 Tax=Listeria monocytogenes TaxID=1639 RepID=UPI003B553E74
LDLVQFVTGERVSELLADLATVMPVRRRPLRDIETFAAAGDVERVDTAMRSDDLAHILVRFAGGGRGSLVVSQVSAGRRNSLRFELDGS